MTRSIVQMLTPADWLVLSQIGLREEVSRATTLIRRGESNSDLFYVLDGNAQAQLDGEGRRIFRLHPGEFFGEMSFLDGEATSAEVIAEPGAIIVRIRGDQCAEVFALNPAFEARLVRYLGVLLARRLRKTERLLSYAEASVGQKQATGPGRVLIKGEYIFRQLSSEREILCAQQLLRTVYIEEQNWKLVERNASGVHERIMFEGAILADKYAPHAVWFGAFHANTLVGCFRVLPYPHHELAEYIEPPLYLCHAGASELNRLAVARDYRAHTFVSLLLLRTAFEFALSLGPTVFVTAPYPEPSSLFIRLGLTPTDWPRFKYNKHDEGEVELLFGDSRVVALADVPLFRVTDRLITAQKHGGSVD